jgi:hypothetical protein
MIFSALRAKSRDDLDFISRQVQLGLDAAVELATWGSGSGPDSADLPGPPLRFHPDVQVRDWTEDTAGGRLIHRRYDTPAGPLTTVVRWTEDWRYGPRVPLFDDWVIPRAEEVLVKADEDLDRLAYVLAPAGDESRALLRRTTAPKLALAREKSLLVVGGLGVGADAAAWLCGHENIIWAATDRPAWLARLMEMLHHWNTQRMEMMLELGVDLFVRRAWYEGVDFFSPAQFRRFILPGLTREVKLAHDAGAAFGYINTTGTMPLLGMLMDAGVDVLIGVDPVQGRGTCLAEMKRMTEGRMALWGGVNGFVTMERGTQQQVRTAVREAMQILGTDRFILSPVDNVTGDSDQVWRNVAALVETWKELRGVSWRRCQRGNYVQ